MYHNSLMKSKLLLLTAVCLLLMGCTTSRDASSNSDSSSSGSQSSSESSSGSSSSSSEGQEDTDYNRPIKSIQDTTILHAWNWKLNDIKSRLKQIDDAGYKSIQISPMQPKVDKTNYADQSTKSQWWKLYQPLDFKVAGNNENFLGTKDELTSLCTEAKKYNINIIVDIVSNHLSGSNGVYNSQVYTQYPLHTYNGNTDDNSAQATVQGRVGGLPDVDTSTTQVQTAVSNMLKEYIDCGIKGFRFDTAKHIETPDDGTYASNFWPTVLGACTSYAQSSKGYTPYYYGEILYQCGQGRKFSSYTPYMSITDNVSGQRVITAIDNETTNNLMSNYPTGVDPTKLVLWAESHDTYANDEKETTDISQENVNKAFVIQNTRKDAASLYLARPDSWTSQICSISEAGWLDKEVVASNYFHRLYNEKAENRSINNSCYINLRGAGNYAGAVIVDTDTRNSVNLNISGLANQKYTDIVTGTEYTINGSTNIALTNGCALLVPSFLATDIPIPEESESYTSSVVLLGTNSTKKYFAYHWMDGQNGSFMAFSKDKDGLGVKLNNNENYIIIEGTSDANASNIYWSNQYFIRQTNDLKYYSTQQIINYSDIVWKTS